MKIFYSIKKIPLEYDQGLGCCLMYPMREKGLRVSKKPTQFSQ